MNYLLDTCVLSEFTHRKPDEKVVSWVGKLNQDEIFICAITLGEIQFGIQRLSESHRKTELQTWMNEIFMKRFQGHILPLEAHSMFLWGSLIASLEKAGQPMPVMDSLIAATALQNNLILVTRNLQDFVACGVQMINPWE